MRRSSLKDVRTHLQRLTVEMLSERKHSAILNDLERFHEVHILSNITCLTTLTAFRRDICRSLQCPGQHCMDKCCILTL